MDGVNSVSATKPVLIVAASAPSLLKLKIMLGKDSFVANIMKCSKDAVCARGATSHIQTV